MGGRLHESYSFQKRIEQADDGFGNILSDWVPQFTQRGSRKYLRGKETVLASRLEGVQPVIITVRKSINVDLVTTDWRIVDSRSNVSFNVRAIEETPTRQYYEILCESGRADG